MGVTGSKLVGGTTNRYGVIRQHVGHPSSQNARSMLAIGISHSQFTELARGTYVPLRPLRAEGFKGALDAPSSRCSSAEERLNPDPAHFDQRRSDRGRLSAHNGEDVGSKPTIGNTRFFILRKGGGQSPPSPTHSTVSHSFPVSRSGWYTYVFIFLHDHVLKFKYFCPDTFVR